MSGNLESMRTGFGRGLVKAGRDNKEIVVLSADLAESTQVSLFQEEFPERYIEVGVAEQNMVTVASGLALAGKRPFAASYAAFSPGRNWEQIRTTICLNNQPVTIIGSHAGLTVGPDGATHQMLEDIALMRSLPNMVVISPGDSLEAERVALALASLDTPSYVRLSREKSPVFLENDQPFEIGKAQLFREGRDVALFGTGIMSHTLMAVAEDLASFGIEAEVVHVPTIKPLDNKAILRSAAKCGRVVTAEDGQVMAGFGGAITELLSDNLPMPIKRLGVLDRFGQSGTAGELLEEYGLSQEKIVSSIRQFINTRPQYHQQEGVNHGFND